MPLHLHKLSRVEALAIRQVGLCPATFSLLPSLCIPYLTAVVEGVETFERFRSEGECYGVCNWMRIYPRVYRIVSFGSFRRTLSLGQTVTTSQCKVHMPTARAVFHHDIPTSLLLSRSIHLITSSLLGSFPPLPIICTQLYIALHHDLD